MLFDFLLKAATLDIEHERKSNFLEWNPITCNYVSLQF